MIWHNCFYEMPFHPERENSSLAEDAEGVVVPKTLRRKDRLEEATLESFVHEAPKAQTSKIGCESLRLSGQRGIG